jgi:5S rRNA maturation endonuclease (ribonuclease M5)
VPSAHSLTQPGPKASVWKGFSIDQLREFGIKANDEGVWVPYYNRDRSLFRAKLFAHDGRSWWLGGQGKGQIPYGLEQLATGGDALVLTEGESDTLALRVAWPNVVAIGIPGASSWKSEWKCVADGFERVYLSFDADEPGRKLADRVALDIPQAKALNLPPGSDTRSVLQQLGKSAYKVLIEAAEASRSFDRAIRDQWRIHDEYQRRAAA